MVRPLLITELEIVTLAYAIMSYICLFWRDKPLNVSRPIRVFATRTTTDSQEDDKAEKTAHEALGVGRRLYEWARDLE